VQRDLERVAFVSRRFQELMGLQSVVFGAGLLLWLLLMALAGGPAVTQEPAHQVGFEGLSFGLAVVLEGRYRATFGTAVSVNWRSGLSHVATSPMLLTLLGVMIAQFAPDAWSGPRLPAALLAGGSLLVLTRDVKWRPHYLILLVASVAALNVSTPPQPALTRPAYIVLTLGIIVTGVFDHRLLLAALGDRQTSTRTQAEHRRVHRGVPRIAGAVSVAAAVAAFVPTPYTMIPLGFGFVVGAWWVTLSAGEGLRVPARLLDVGVRGLHEDEAVDMPEPAPVFFASAWSLGSILALTLAAAADASRPGAPPIFLEVAFAACAAAAAVQHWSRRKHYLLGVLASLLALAAGSLLQPMQAFALFISLAAAAVALGAWLEAIDAPGSTWQLGGVR
jgi:hypothetical protein